MEAQAPMSDMPIDTGTTPAGGGMSGSGLSQWMGRWQMSAAVDATRLAASRSTQAAHPDAYTCSECTRLR